MVFVGMVRRESAKVVKRGIIGFHFGKILFEKKTRFSFLISLPCFGKIKNTMVS